MPEQLLLRHETLSLSLDIVYVVDIASVVLVIQHKLSALKSTNPDE